MRIASQVVTDTNTLMVYTSERDGWMYLRIRGDGGSIDLKLTDENRDALRTVLSPTETWSGIIR